MPSDPTIPIGTENAPATLPDSIAAEVAAEATHYLLTMYPTARAGQHPAMLRSLRAVIAREPLKAMAEAVEKDVPDAQ